MMFRCFVAATLLAAVVGCSGLGPSGLLRSTSPHEQYAQSLRSAGLDRTALGRDWLAAAERAGRDSIRVALPYREQGYFSPSRPWAAGYRLNARRGDRLRLSVETQGRDSVRLFVDVFEIDGNRLRAIATSAVPDRDRERRNVVSWEPRRDQAFLIRIQPELLRSARYIIEITREPVLAFPVQGKDSRQIASFFGADRDGGRRRHEGIDVFAARGTPTLASVNGIITSVGQNELGGNVVFLSDPARGQQLYYAHLDRFNVTTGQRVAVGDTVGFVGNTGNARTTAPHLHFGIYEVNGAVDPLPFVRRGTGPAQQPLLAPDRLGDSLRIRTATARLRIAPDGDAPTLRSVERNTAVEVLGGTADFLRIRSADGLVGYVLADATESLRALRQLTVPRALPLLDEAHPQGAVISDVPAQSNVAVLATQGGFQLVRTSAGIIGWITLQ